ncbi:MAG: 50S ribosomal protein L24 [Chlamydiae bacterium]|nr:50S ribosomal protein L24 [Chlamydiota bacterium]
MSKFIRQSDTVIVIAGNDKNKIGKVIARNGDRLIIEGVNVRKKHMKRTQQGPGRIIEREGPIHISNVQFALKDGTPVKLKVRKSSEGEKELVYQKDGVSILYRSVKRLAE